MHPVPTRKQTALTVALEQRREELDIPRWRDVADNAGISDETIRAISNRTTKPSARQSKAERKLEAALGWVHGSLQAIREGGQPTPVNAGYPAYVDDDEGLRAIWDIKSLPDRERELAILAIQTRRRQIALTRERRARAALEDSATSA